MYDVVVKECECLGTLDSQNLQVIGWIVIEIPSSPGSERAGLLDTEPASARFSRTSISIRGMASAPSADRGIHGSFDGLPISVQPET